jgi:hypothetical protein
MAETKYGKYFIDHDNEKWRWPTERRPVMSRMDDSVAKGSYFYLIHWMFPTEGGTTGFGVTNPKDADAARVRFGSSDLVFTHPMAGHPPHIHKDAELLFHIGTNPDDPMDLGAEVQMYMGPEMERHVFNRTCCIYIPPNFIHSPWKPLKTTRPWIFIEVNQGPVHTEKSFRQLLPKELRETINWKDMWHDEGY